MSLGGGGPGVIMICTWFLIGSNVCPTLCDMMICDDLQSLRTGLQAVPTHPASAHGGADGILRQKLRCLVRAAGWIENY